MEAETQERDPLCDPELLAARARDNAQMAADFLWADNRTAAREHLRRALYLLNQADGAAAIIDV